ncbi:MAG: hypothetical protein ABJI10_09100 [Ekhidna sp.]
MKIVLLQLILFVSCSSSDTNAIAQKGQADVTKVSTSGSENSYTFFVTLESPDTGCEQYADWWEVLSESGDLIYRRILLHSHVNEQPFTRSGGAVSIAQEQVVWVRAHMNNSGYGGKVMKGSVKSGFISAEFPDNLGEGLDLIDPLPTGCAF